MSERRTVWLLVFVLLAQFLLLAGQVADPGGRGTRLEAAVLRIVGPLTRLVAGTTRLVEGFSRGFVLRRTLLEENRRLRQEVAELNREVLRGRGTQDELRRLAEALDYARSEDAPLRVADIVYIDHASGLQALVLYVGEGAVRVNQPVVAAAGLVGRVVVTGGRYAKVQLITDRAATVGAQVERTRRQGIVRGAESGLLELEFVPLQADIRVGDRIVTAGIDGVYPRGIAIGTVTSVERGSDLFHEVRLVPAINLGRLDQVYVLDRTPVPDEIKQAQPNADS